MIKTNLNVPSSKCNSVGRDNSEELKKNARNSSVK